MALIKSTTSGPLHEVVEREYPRNTPGLIAQLRSTDPEQRRWAARDLASHNTPDTIAALGAQLLQEHDHGVREALFSSLAQASSEAAAAALLPLLRSEDALLRNRAMETLAGMPNAVAPRIAALLQDRDPDVRILTINLLGELRHAQVTPWLLQVLHRDEHTNVVATAIEVLAEAGLPEHVPALREARQRFAQDPFIGFAVDLAIERIEAA